MMWSSHGGDGLGASRPSAGRLACWRPISVTGVHPGCGSNVHERNRPAARHQITGLKVIDRSVANAVPVNGVLLGEDGQRPKRDLNLVLAVVSSQAWRA